MNPITQLQLCLDALSSKVQRLQYSTVQIATGGTGATTAAGARANLDVPSNADLAAASVGGTIYQGQITSLGAAIPAAGTVGRYYVSTVAGTLTDPDAGSAVVAIGGYLTDNGSAWLARPAPILMDAPTANYLRDTSRFPTSRNLLDHSKCLVGYAINTSGVATNIGGSYRASDFFPVTPGGNFISTGDLTVSASYGTAFYDYKKTFISFLASTPASTAIAVPATACYARVSITAGVTTRENYAIFDGTTIPTAIPGAQWVDTLTNNANSLAWTRERNTIINWFDWKTTTPGYTLSTASGSPNLESAVGNFSISNYIPVIAGEQITLSIATGAGTNFGIVWYSQSKAYIAITAGALTANTPYTVPALAAYCRFCLLTSLTKDMVVFHSKVFSCGTTSGSTAVTNTSTTLGLLVGQSVSGAGIPSGATIVAVASGTGFTLSAAATATATSSLTFGPVGYTNATNATCGTTNASTAVTNTSTTLGLVIGQTVTGAGIPAGATIAAVAVGTGFTLSIAATATGSVILTFGPVSYRDFGGSARSVRRWQGMNLGVQGDSITANPGWKTVVNRYLNTKLTLDNSLSGSSMGYHIGTITSGMFANIDILIIALGTNDYGFNRPLGALGDAASPAGAYGVYNGTGTFYGDVRGLIEAILTEKPTLRFGFTTPLPRTQAASGGSGSGTTAVNGSGNTLRQFAQAIIDVCGRYSIPALDLNLTSGLNTYNLSAYTLTNDGLHPTTACADFYAPQIGKWAEGL
jgi:hypothetical protein